MPLSFVFFLSLAFVTIEGVTTSALPFFNVVPKFSTLSIGSLGWLFLFRCPSSKSIFYFLLFKALGCFSRTCLPPCGNSCISSWKILRDGSPCLSQHFHRRNFSALWSSYRSAWYWHWPLTLILHWGKCIIIGWRLHTSYIGLRFLSTMHFFNRWFLVIWGVLEAWGLGFSSEWLGLIFLWWCFQGFVCFFADTWRVSGWLIPATIFQISAISSLVVQLFLGKAYKLTQ